MFLSGSKRIFLEESSCLPKNAKKRTKKKGEEEGKQQHIQNARLKNTLKNGRYASTPARIVFFFACVAFSLAVSCSLVSSRSFGRRLMKRKDRRL